MSDDEIVDLLIAEIKHDLVMSLSFEMIVLGIFNIPLPEIPHVFPWRLA